jgi:hypothetical protein
LPWTKSPAAHDVNPVAPDGTLLVNRAVFETVTPPVEADTLIPLPAVSDVTPVLVQLTAPVVGEHATPDDPVTPDTAPL